MTVGEFAERVVQLAAAVPFSVTSWGRTAQRNTAEGGVPHSPHRVWVGVDGIPDDPAQGEDLQEMALRLGLKAFFEGDHYHIQPADWIPG